ncbi:hypothetical protein ABEB36_008521 [Hypothenemus hampei]|uniref:IRS-type PTB domain-containing protein n=1 Tax=Hypothenemus hampei TaxID=57062 RepID=A0ABD1EMK8_HYPHA
MGCVYSKSDINDTHPNIFHVINVNDRGKPVSRGKLEVTEIELILHQKGKNPIKWPLRSLRKYGWDVNTDVFSIECGRRSPTGPGYFAFKCRKAEQLFNMVQHHIIAGVQEPSFAPTNDTSQLVHNSHHNNIDFSVLGTSNGPHTLGTLALRPDHSLGIMPDACVASPVQPISSNGISLTPIKPGPQGIVSTPLEHNNNKQDNSTVETNIGFPSYANLSGDIDPTPHVYMNIDTKENNQNFIENRDQPKEFNEEVHSYANIDTRDADNIQLLQQLNFCNNMQNNNGAMPVYSPNSVTCTPTLNELDYGIVREVNYAELDLDSSKKDSGVYQNGHAGGSQKPVDNNIALAQQESPNAQKKSYATIDFPKTIALSQSIKPKADLEEGSRKTRHNSTINSFSD